MTANSKNSNLVEMKGIVKTFPGVLALDHVDFSLHAGELHGLVGKNGAGKTTLMNVLTGIYQPDQGEIWVDGEHIHPMTAQRARQAGITCVHQRSNLTPPLSVAENIFIGGWPTSRSGFVDWRGLYEEAEKKLQRLGLEIDVRRRVEGLSVAEKQVIEIAAALFANARIIILDEATAPLPKDEVNMLFGFVRRQRDEGVTFIYISHYIEEVFQLCGVVSVLRDGEVVTTRPVASLDQAELIHLITGVTVERFKRERGRQGARPVLEIRGLTRPGKFDNINLAVKEGEIVGLTGLEGCGKGELLKGLFGLEPLGEGTVLVEGKPYWPSNPAEALRRRVGYLPRDRLLLGIIGMRPTAENISLPILRRLVNRFGLLRLGEERRVVTRFIELLGIVTPSMWQPVEFLSGGNQQKVVFAKLAGTEPKVLLLDEPTQGVDVAAKIEIMRIVDQMSHQGVGVLFVSEEIQELLDVCDRIVVMFAGKLDGEFVPGDPTVNAERILLAVEGSLAHNESEKIHTGIAQ
ncbi:MAG: sugar ABC transporter ATP-binding protein [Anaerolineales bacterium]|jgi:ABC-type sugar transport system ATPase subunit